MGAQYVRMSLLAAASVIGGIQLFGKATETLAPLWNGMSFPQRATVKILFTVLITIIPNSKWFFLVEAGKADTSEVGSQMRSKYFYLFLILLNVGALLGRRSALSLSPVKKLE